MAPHSLRAGRDALILIVGSPRSGTTWLAKLFDSHPRVLYRHEPDAIVPPPSFPQFPDPEDVAGYLEPARAFVRAMRDTNAARAVGAPPLFRKSYLSPPAYWLRVALLHGIKLASRLLGNPGWTDRLPIPDFGAPDGPRPVTVVMKSVVSNGRALLYSRAVPELKLIHLVRHPGGQFASLKRGRQGFLRDSGHFPAKTLSRSRIGTQYGLTAGHLDTMTPIEQATWQWIIVNETLMTDLANRPAYCILRYEDLCADPITHMKALFDFGGLDWNEQSRAFIERSLTFEGDATGYFDVVRNPAIAAAKWLDELTEAEVSIITRLAAATPPGKLFFGSA